MDDIQQQRNVGVQRQAVQAFLEQYFPGIDDSNLPAAVAHIVSCIHTEHRIYPVGPCRQTLLISYRDPAATKHAAASSTGRAVVRMQLAYGLVYELHINGRLASAVQCLDPIAAWLAHQPYDTDAFDRYDAFLSGLVDAGQADSSPCIISIAKQASIAPPPTISQQMMLKMAFAAFNLLRRDCGLPPLAEAPQLLTDLLRAKQDDANRALQHYLAGLDQAALAVVRDFRSRYHRRYDDLKVYNFLVADNRHHCRNRVQAVRELPWLLRILSGMDKMHSYDAGATPASRRTDPHAVARITHAIDAGAGLFDAVAQALRVPRETVRWTHYRMLPHVGLFAVPRMDLLLTMLSWLPVEKRPQTDAHWRSMRAVMCALLPVLTAVCDAADLADALTTDPRYGRIMTQWLRDLARPTLCDASAYIDRMKRAGADPADVKDFVSALLRSLRRIGSHAHSQGNAHVDVSLGMLLDWLVSQSFHSVMGASRRWHASMLNYLDQQGAAPSTVTVSAKTKWVAVVPSTHVRSLTIVELTDSDSLMQEGQAMGHCVGGYSQQCAVEDALIFSVRDIDGRRLSTAELTLHGDSLRVSLRQHKGRKNTPPPAHCEAAIAKLVALMNGPDFREQLAARRDFQQALRSKHNAMQEMRSTRVESYRRIEEDQAWHCAFDRPR